MSPEFWKPEGIYRVFLLVFCIVFSLRSSKAASIKVYEAFRVFSWGRERDKKRGPRGYYNETSLTHLLGTLLWTSERVFQHENKPVFSELIMSCENSLYLSATWTSRFPRAGWKSLHSFFTYFGSSSISHLLPQRTSFITYGAALLSVSGMSYFLPRPHCRKCTVCTDCAWRSHIYHLECL